MLTIGELARAVGVSTRTVRWYHERGLLPEPERDASGYRRYTASDVIRLSRIVALAAAGVPLTRIATLLEADDAGFAEGLEVVGAEVRAEIGRLRRVRTSLAGLRSADRLALPDELGDAVDFLRATDAPRQWVDFWRDTSILTYALYPTIFRRWLREHSFETDPAHLDLVARSLTLADADPEDPRIARLAEDTVAWLVANPTYYTSAAGLGPENPRHDAVFTTHRVDTPAWARLTELTLEAMRAAGLPTDLLG